MGIFRQDVIDSGRREMKNPQRMTDEELISPIRQPDPQPFEGCLLFEIIIVILWAIVMWNAIWR